jgi:phage shock protein C
MEKKLYRDERHKILAGVCAGIAEYLNIDVTIVRILFFLTLILKGGGGILYIILWIVLPKKVYYFNDPQVDYTFKQEPVNNPFQNMPPPQPGVPFTMPPKIRSNAGLIVGIALVMFGTLFLLNEFDLFADWDIERLWPLVLVVAGVVVLINGTRKNPWEKDNWNTFDKKPEAQVNNNDTVQNDHPADNPPTV